MTMFVLLFVVSFVTVSPCVVLGMSGEENESEQYAAHIKPIFRERCYSCHGALKQEGGLRLDTVEFATKGGETGLVISSGSPDQSVLVHRIESKDDSIRMPPEGKPLTSDETKAIRAWIASGAHGPLNEQPEEDPRQHWAFQKPNRPTVPTLANSAGSKRSDNPIDAFLAEHRLAAAVQPMPETDKATLLRRVYLDLIGLPPTESELQGFLSDTSSTAYEDVVDRLLKSPQHGERWGRHWMDVWRYSDWYGRRSVPDVMNSYPMIWRWRDWIVRSVNEDKPYDRMVTEMLAADEMCPTDEQNIVATGYLARSWFKWNYETWKKDLVEHTGKAFLGLTLNCAQCHDHKYDPLSQEEYFRFRAFFEPLEMRHDRVAGEPDPGRFKKYVYVESYGPIRSGMIRVFDEYLDAETYMFSKGDSRLRIEGKPPVSPAAPAVLGGDQLQTQRMTLPIEAAYPGMKQFVREEELNKRRAALDAARTNHANVVASTAAVPESQQRELSEAQAAYQSARDKAMASLGEEARSRVLTGAQSLVLDAKTGRRALSHSLPGIDAMQDGGVVSYLVRIVQDGHTNLQLGLDIAQGATGGFIGFEGGRIKTYAPGGFNEITFGNYDLSRGQTTFRVTMTLDFASDVFRIHVTSITDNVVLVDNVAAGLNGWRPVANGRRGMFIDCRTGTEAIYDQIEFSQPDRSLLLVFDFEAPAHRDDQDVVDAPAVDGGSTWMTTSFCAAPATSKVRSAVSQDPAVRDALARLVAAQQAVRLPNLKRTAAELQLAAAEVDLKSIEQRIAADDARYASGKLAEDRKDDPAVRDLIHSAWSLEQDAAAAMAHAKIANAEATIADIETRLSNAAMPLEQAQRDALNQESSVAQKSRSQAQSALTTALANLAKEPGDYTPLSPQYLQESSGRRSVLAQWIANRENPLTARVAVNHIWLRHFGQAIVESTHDFGRNGSRPTHPKLLDWLACELMDSGWSMKHLHRLIVTSEAYRMTSVAPASSEIAAVLTAQVSHNVSVDPENKLLWRFPSSRMQAEVVRDSLLAVAGELDLTMGGHELEHRDGMTSRRRSLYFAHHGEEKMEFLELFDAANPCDCYKRASSVQPQQALALANSELTISLSRSLAAKLWQTSEENRTSDEAIGVFIERSFLHILNREASESERQASLQFLTEQTSRQQRGSDATPSAEATARAHASFVHALMNHNDFVTIR